MSQAILQAQQNLALQAISRYDPQAQQVNIYAIVPEFGGGVMMLAEFTNKSSNGQRHEYFVHVKDGTAWVYSDYAMAMRVGSKQADVIAKIVSADFVTAIVTVMLVGSFIFLALDEARAQTEATKMLATALTTVLGFWFGRQTK
ncbi:hypothetical protein [Neorhizobium alkalisoli]|uniref:Uncharacterized protein n=1 Tax=Neorhizobium alkalisoli TaxID=528178 RepID=A0A561QX00_9HYPH|nr:hypothetical protein [Neorhizobium alkalisoli]TWF54900.1 hypothetical protein FHW37_103771 [Neorhizobium alkalisoli]